MLTAPRRHNRPQTVAVAILILLGISLVAPAPSGGTSSIASDTLASLAVQRVSHNQNLENTSEVVAYGDIEAATYRGLANWFADVADSSGSWKLAQPAKPDPQIEHQGYSRVVSNMVPPDRGNFWYPQYYDNQVVVPHFVACDNNNTPTFGCQTGVMSIGVYDLGCPTCSPNGQFRRIRIPRADSRNFGPGSVADIVIDQTGVTGHKGRLYYVANPNYIGYLDYDPALRTWVHPPVGTNQNAHSTLSITGVCPAGGTDACGTANELTILQSGDIAVIDRNGWDLAGTGRGVLVFRPDLRRFGDPNTGPLYAYLPTPDRSRLFPYSIAASPVCAGPQAPGAPGPGKCRRARFVINFDYIPGQMAYTTTPLQEYVWDLDAFGFPNAPMGILPATDAWEQTAKTGSGRYIRVDPAAFRAIKYDKEGTLWASTFDPNITCVPGKASCGDYGPGTARSHYHSALVFAFYPERDLTGQGGDKYPWHPDAGNGTCSRTHSPPVGSPPTFLVCRPAPNGLFHSTGKLVDSFVEAGSNIYWAGWLGSFEGLIRTNRGQWPPSFVPHPSWRVQGSVPNSCADYRGFQHPDAFDPIVCNPDARRRGIESVMGAVFISSSKYHQYRHLGPLTNQVTRLVYDPDRNAVWTTVQGWIKDCPKGLSGEDVCTPPHKYPNNVFMPQWLMRFNVTLTQPQYQVYNKPFVSNPTGSVAGTPNQQVTIGAKVYSDHRLTSVRVFREEGGSVTTPHVTVSESGPGLYTISADVKVPDGGNTAKYRIEATNTHGSNATPKFDIIPSSNASTTWHFAEGYLNNHPDQKWRVYTTIANPDQTRDAIVDVTYRPEPLTGDVTPLVPFTKTCTVPAGSRLTLHALDVLAIGGSGNPAGGRGTCSPGSANWSSQPRGFSTSVISKAVGSTPAIPVIAERPSYFETKQFFGGSVTVNGTHNAMGVNAPSEKWLFAEGFFSNFAPNRFDNYLTLSNLDSASVNATVRLLPESGAPLAQVFTVPANNRITINISERLLSPGGFGGGTFANGTGFGIEVTAPRPVLVAERPIYYEARPIPSLDKTVIGGDVAIGTPRGRSRWILAEGRVQNNIQTWLTVANPITAEVSGEISLYAGSNVNVVRSFTVPARGRRTIDINRVLSEGVVIGGGKDVAIEVRASDAVVVERPLYFFASPGLASPVDGGHHTVGTTTSRTTWGMAEGFVAPERCSGVADQSEYITLANPGVVDASAKLEFLLEDGTRIPHNVNRIAPGARVTVSVHDILKSKAGFCNRGSFGFGTTVTSGKTPIVVERPMYWNRDTAGLFVMGGHNVLPRHTFGLNTTDATTLSTSSGYAETLSAAVKPPPSFAVVSSTGDITATAGQQIVIEAETTGTVDAVDVAYNYSPIFNTYPMTRIGGPDSNRWASTFTATESGIFQVVAKSGGWQALGDAQALNVIDGAITGRVTGDEGAGLGNPAISGVRIRAFSPTGLAGEARTNADGYYAIPLPGPGDYKLQIEPTNTPGQTPGWADMYSVHTPSENDSSPIHVPEAGASYDEVLPKAGRIFGKVTGQSTSHLSFAENRVAFSSDRDGNDEIYLMDSDGSNQIRLTDHMASDIWPSFSPDGTRIAFASNRDGAANPEGDYELYVMNTDGTNLTRLTDNSEDDHFPAWSPDGQKIAFSRPATGGLDLFVIGANGTGEVNLTNSAGETEAHAAWSPDSSEIVFTRAIGFLQLSVGKISADGASKVILSDQQDQIPSYSPDGTKITFTSYRDGGDGEIYLMSSDGSNQTRLTNSPGVDAASRYALDGSRIVFVSNRHNPAPTRDLDLYLMNPDGSGQVRLTSGASLTAPPSLGASETPGTPIPLGDVSVGFFDRVTNKTIGGPVFTDAQGNYEKWLPPGNYYALVNSPTTPKPLGWNGYSPVWSKGQLFDAANGGDLTYFALPNPTTSLRYDESLPPVYPVRGKVVPQGGPGLGADGKVGSYRAISPFGQFWAVDLPNDGNYTYRLPNGQWKIVYVVPGYRNSYYHDTEDFDQARVVTVAGSGKTLEDQHIYPE